jgi:hypothetical protein
MSVHYHIKLVVNYTTRVQEVLEIHPYTSLELLSIPGFHTDTYQYPFIFLHFSGGISLFLPVWWPGLKNSPTVTHNPWRYRL